jgi:epoxyqueuosine reductase
MRVEPEQLRARLHATGFDVVRFAAAAPATDGAALSRWLAAGYQADLGWMERSLAKRSDPALVLPGARSLVLLGVNYGDVAPMASTGEGPIWARYALHTDYHDTIRPGLQAAGRVLEELGGLRPEDYRYYVDTGPVLERGWAARAGLGFIGKNAMLISRDYGNWLFLAAILTRLELPPDPPLALAGVPEARTGVGLLCGKCTRCLVACPTEAFPAPGVVDARRCISYHTIENKGIIPRELRTAIGARIYGCDVCLEVCPWNRFAQQARSGLLEARPELSQLSLREILELTPERFAAVFRGTAMKRLKRRGLLRNACIVAANTGATECLDVLVRLAGEGEPLVRAHAVWAVRRLGAADRLATAWAAETEPSVREEYAAPLEGSVTA